MSKLVNEVMALNKDNLSFNKNNRGGVTFLKDGLTFSVYDQENLTGFTLEGGGAYIVHDSDNYDKKK